MKTIAFILCILILFTSCSSSPAGGSKSGYKKKSKKQVWREDFIDDCKQDLFKSEGGCACVADDILNVMSKSYYKYSVSAILNCFNPAFAITSP